MSSLGPPLHKSTSWRKNKIHISYQFCGTSPNLVLPLMRFEGCRAKIPNTLWNTFRFRCFARDCVRFCHKWNVVTDLSSPHASRSWHHSENSPRKVTKKSKYQSWFDFSFLKCVWLSRSFVWSSVNIRCCIIFVLFKSIMLTSWVYISSWACQSMWNQSVFVNFQCKESNSLL